MNDSIEKCLDSQQLKDYLIHDADAIVQCAYHNNYCLQETLLNDLSNALKWWTCYKRVSVVYK